MKTAELKKVLLTSEYDDVFGKIYKSEDIAKQK